MVYKDNGKAILKSHALALEYRHRFLAHGGTEELEYSFPLFMPAAPYDEATLFPINIKIRVPLLSEVRKFDRLFKQAEKHVFAKMEEMKPRVIDILEAEWADKFAKRKRQKKSIG